MLRHATRVLDKLQVPYMLVGSFASTAYGEPRLTQDIDMVLDLPPSRVDAFCAAFPESEFYVSREAVADAVRRRLPFYVPHPESGNKIDFILPRSDDWGSEQLRRRRPMPILPDQTVDTAAPEDVILGKLWYFAEGGSEKHLRDVAGMLKVCGAAWVDRQRARPTARTG